MEGPVLPECLSYAFVVVILVDSVHQHQNVTRLMGRGGLTAIVGDCELLSIALQPNHLGYRLQIIAKLFGWLILVFLNDKTVLVAKEPLS